MSTHNMFLLRNKIDISRFRMKKVPYLLLCNIQDGGHGGSLKTILNC